MTKTIIISKTTVSCFKVVALKTTGPKSHRTWPSSCWGNDGMQSKRRDLELYNFAICAQTKENGPSGSGHCWLFISSVNDPLLPHLIAYFWREHISLTTILPAGKVSLFCECDSQQAAVIDRWTPRGRMWPAYCRGGAPSVCTGAPHCLQIADKKRKNKTWRRSSGSENPKRQSRH